VNLILFEPAEMDAPLSRRDRRAVHLLDVLKRQPGDSFEAGVINGSRGQATLRAITADNLLFSFTATAEPPPPERITLIIGLPRPQTARDVLRDATTLGAAALHFVRTEKAPASYAESSLWSTGEWRRHVIAGAEQAACTRLPDVTHGQSLATIVAALPPGGARWALDNYEAAQRWGEADLRGEQPLCLAIGAERGWSARERDVLRAQGFALAHLGPRVLRTETAVIAALAVIRARSGLM
jgi:16S rRNA (uracil1498-N3)-methyltransferase